MVVVFSFISLSIYISPYGWYAMHYNFMYVLLLPPNKGRLRIKDAQEVFP